MGTGTAGRYVLHDGQDLTVSCAEGDNGHDLLTGSQRLHDRGYPPRQHPETKTRVMLNVARPFPPQRLLAAARRGFGAGADGFPDLPT